MVCLVVVFAFMGVLVYDKFWLRVAITLTSNVLLAALGLLEATRHQMKTISLILRSVPQAKPSRSQSHVLAKELSKRTLITESEVCSDLGYRMI